MSSACYAAWLRKEAVLCFSFSGIDSLWKRECILHQRVIVTCFSCSFSPTPQDLNHIHFCQNAFITQTTVCIDIVVVKVSISGRVASRCRSRIEQAAYTSESNDKARTNNVYHFNNEGHKDEGLPQQAIQDDMSTHDAQANSLIEASLSSKRSWSAFSKIEWSHLIEDLWLWDFLAISTSFISLLAIILTPRLHDGHPLPNWPFSITINSLVSVFAIVLSRAMLAPIAEGISQAKWHWFLKSHQLWDVEVFDKASRGPWGALKMLWCISWRYVKL